MALLPLCSNKTYQSAVLINSIAWKQGNKTLTVANNINTEEQLSCKWKNTNLKTTQWTEWLQCDTV